MGGSKFAYLLISIVTMFAVNGALAATSVTTDYSRSLSFEPNQGQTDKQIDFVARGAAYSLFLSHGQSIIRVGARVNGSTLRMSFAGGNSSARAEALNPQPGKSNYFLGNVPEQWHTNIPNYARIRYRSIYRGVDLIYHGNQRQVEYDLIVAPPADPRALALQFEGATEIDLDRSGDLVLQTGAGEVRWHKPVGYQDVGGRRKLVDCRYRLRQRGEVSLQLAHMTATNR